MRVLVTGGVGFIGYHTSRALLARGDHVHVLDDFSDAPYPTLEKRRNEADLRAAFADACTIERGCVTDRTAVTRAMQDVDAVVHLAGLAGVRPSFAAPAHYARVNVEGTATVLEVARSLNVHRLLFASSSSVYGDGTPLPAGEEAAAVTPESPYAASKRAAELMAEAFVKSVPELSCHALRFFTVYGPRQRPEMAITKFARALLTDAPITVFGDGSMRRDFTHVDDIVRGVLAALDHRAPGYRAYNLGSGNPVSLTQLLEAMQHAAGRAAKVGHADKPLGDVDTTYADITRAKVELGWSPQISLNEGLESVFAFLVERAATPSA